MNPTTEPRACRSPSAPLGGHSGCLLPILVPLVLIAAGAIADVAEATNAVLVFLGNANITLFIGLLIACAMVRSSLGADGVETVVTSGLRTTGEILLVTGVGGSLGRHRRERP